MFRFTIRDLLWLTVVVALALALWREHRLLRQEQQRLGQEQRLVREWREAHANEVERFEELWQTVNSPFGSSDDMLRRRPRQFPPEK